MAESNVHVGIIGAGLSGLALALALHQQSIPCTVYESREEKCLGIGGGLMLFPNGLKVMDKLCIHKLLKNQGFNFDRIYIQDGTSMQVTETVEYGSLDRYGFHALRIYRSILLDHLLAAVREKSIPVHFNRHFDHIVSETEEGVTWQFRNGSTASASILIGADGIHSKLRSYLAPNLEPTFSGMAAVIAAVPYAQLGLPEPTGASLNDPSSPNPLPTCIVVPPYGGFVMAPQGDYGGDVMITVQRRIDEPSSGRWDSVRAFPAHCPECRA
ncbi:hypothetical protein NQ176_g2536 [Zarea fungicola]|uniref:Uncharacterized protein n=1 Tax=Zarea fungicola TaxID=93591 RepID=A0ACC1NMS4_9HYPO|nr:hypothetical protein NQ176_g2536 [Lecanicillium fungicola]